MASHLITDADCFVSRWTVAEEHKDEFLGIFTALVEAFKPGMDTMTHFVFYGWSRGGEFVAIESWKSADIVGAVRNDPNFVGTVSKLLSLCSKPMVMENFAGWHSDRSIFAAHPAGPSTVHPKAGEIGGIYL